MRATSLAGAFAGNRNGRLADNYEMAISNRAPTFVPRYVRPDQQGWARGTRELIDQLRTIRWHPGSGTAIALRVLALFGPGRRREVISVPLGTLLAVHPVSPGDAQLAARQ